MYTVLELISLSTDYLEKKGIESPRLNAELLLSEVLHCKRFDLYLQFDRPLKEDEVKLYREFIKRRGLFEPLQYIAGKVEFYGLEFMVSPSVLIPRQETEILVEAVIEDLNDKENLSLLDIGTGSGIIAVCLAKNLNLKIDAVDTSKEALLIAKQNAALNSVGDKIDFYFKDILSAENFPKKYDVIVSNPPYISEEEFESLQPELKVYEPKNALTDYSNGYKFYEAITLRGKELLKENGKIYFETGKGQFKKVIEILEANGFENIKIKKDYLNIERTISGELQ